MSTIGWYESPKVEPMDEPEWGTHTIPSHPKSMPLTQRKLENSFWTSGKAPLLKDDGFRARRAAKHARHLKNQDEKREINRNGGVKRGK